MGPSEASRSALAFARGVAELNLGDACADAGSHEVESRASARSRRP